MVAGSNPASGATISSNFPQARDSKQNTNTNYDTITKQKYATAKNLRLYKVSDTFYYRRRIKQKLFRVSLHTKDIKVALHRKKILDLIKGEDMYKIETGDFKLMFEYDTEEELRTALEQAKEIQIQAQVQRFREVKTHVENSEAQSQSDLTFELLRDKYLYRKKQDNRVSADSIGAYTTTFKMLIKAFKDIPIEKLKVEDFEIWKDKLVAEKSRINRTINKHLNYTKNFLQFAQERQLISHNNAKPVALLDEVKDNQKRKQQVENYSKQDIKAILEYKYTDPIFIKIFQIALYTALRQNEIKALTQEDIIKDKETGIYYFNITKSKSMAGIRRVPIHKDILEMVLSTQFPLIPNLTRNAFSKKVRYQLYKVIDRKSDKNFHTFRGTFIKHAIEANTDNSNAIFMIQEIVGHANGETALTLERYAKGYKLSTLHELVNRVAF